MASPIIIAHRGASAFRPEHSLMAYKLAIEQGADFIEPDLVMTRDGHLVARHENEIGGTTNVSELPQFNARMTSKTIDGQKVSGWFTEDFTLAELKQLQVRERLPNLRPGNRRFDDQETIPTLDDVLALVKHEELRTGRRIGIYPETKHPAYFRSIGLPMEEALLNALTSYSYKSKYDPVFIQSFEIENLKFLRSKTQLRLVQLIAPLGGPADQPGLSYAAMLTPGGLKAIAAYADGIGAEKSLVIPRLSDGRLGEATQLVEHAHAAGLRVHLWTFRPENQFLPTDFRTGTDPAGAGDAAGEIRRYLATGIDGLFTDSVPPAVAARQAEIR